MRTLQIPPSVRSVFSQDGAVVMEIKQGMMYTSNPVGGRIFELLSQGCSEEQVVSMIATECEVEQDTVRCDLEKFVAELSSYGLIAETSATA